jgi:hypothetical protein
LRLAPVVTSNRLDLLVVNAPGPETQALHIERDASVVTLHSPSEFHGFFLQHTTNLVNPRWETLGFASSNVTILIDSSTPQRYFRLSDPQCCDDAN